MGFSSFYDNKILLPLLKGIRYSLSVMHSVIKTPDGNFVTN